jgi:hypothetical protein
MQCKICNNEFVPKVHNAKFCSDKCRHKSVYLTIRSKCINKCLVCQTPTPNPKYCSIKCAATNNPICQHKPTLCQTCGKQISDKWIQIKECQECKLIRQQKWHSNMTLGEFKNALPRLQFHAALRGLSRKVLVPTGTCSQCNYNKHTNICHIKQVKNFDDTALVSEVNSISNLTELCPNCHWELDHPI